MIYAYLCLIGMHESVSAQNISINIQTTNATCNTKNGSITVTATAGTPPYQYKINGDGPFDNGFYPAVAPGTYSIEVKDAAGKTATASATVSNTNNPPLVTVTSFTNPSTCTNADGSFVVAPSSGTPPYEFSLDMVNFTTNSSFSNLAAGFYTVMVRDAKGCTGEVRVTLTNPNNCGIPIAVTYPSPICGNEGTITITYLGNNPPYENSLNGAPFGSTTQYSNITPGPYTLQVRSSIGETTTFMFYVVKGCTPVTQATVTDNTCNNANGTITLTTTKGTPPYRYSINGINFQTSNVFTGLGAGRYNIGVADAAGALSRTEAHVNGGCFQVSENHTDVTCSSTDGTIELTASGGTGPYQYSLNDGAFQAGNTFTHLSAGTYRITVKDANSATKSITVEIKNISGPTRVVPAAPPGCLGDNVKMTISASGGTAPLQYSINDADYQPLPEFDVVTGQSYSVYVKDANGCKISTTYLPPVGCFQVTTNITNADCGVNNGAFEVTVTDGNPPFEYSIDGVNFQTSNIFSNLSTRRYQLTVRDAETNTQIINVNIGSTCPQLRVAIQNASCGNSNGAITLTGSGGQPPYQFSFNGGPYAPQNTFTNLVDATYNVAMRDASGYVVQRQAVVANTLNPQLSVASTDAICSAGGMIDITASGGTGALWFSIDGTNYSVNPKFTQVQPAVYQVYVVDNLGCRSSTQVEVQLIRDLSLDITGNFSICENEPAVVSVIDPKPTFAYTWTSDDGSVSGNGSSLNVRPDITREYTVQVTDGLCVATGSTIVTVHPLPVADAGDDIIVCYGENARLTGSGGYSYTWSPSTYLSNASSYNPEVIKPVASQEYQLIVKNEYGCASAEASSVLVSVLPPVEVFAGRDTIVVKGMPFQLNALDVKNSGFTSYVWTPSIGLSDPQSQAPVATLQSSTVYTVKATTINGCESTDDIKIQAYTGPDIYVPNAFSPNNDGVNDDFKIFPVGIKTFKYLAVYNRWGHRIYYSTDVSKGWNGVAGSKMADAGAYVWMVEGVDVNDKVVSKRGVVQLVR
ncbi:MAG: gliding motility-associated C-terminal domain-containing protein [Chitinophagaceae bacterium]|nr:gliding motility-associated C-terminal domain-containing protein [Chitinophagaceae bacterium]